MGWEERSFLCLLYSSAWSSQLRLVRCAGCLRGEWRSQHKEWRKAEKLYLNRRKDIEKVMKKVGDWLLGPCFSMQVCDIPNAGTSALLKAMVWSGGVGEKKLHADVFVLWLALVFRTGLSAGSCFFSYLPCIQVGEIKLSLKIATHATFIHASSNWAVIQRQPVRVIRRMIHTNTHTLSDCSLNEEIPTKAAVQTKYLENRAWLSKI